MRADWQPVWFLRQAVLLLVLGAVEFLIVAMVLQSRVFDSVAPQVKPWDESKWVALATHVTPSAAFEKLTGATPEEVVQKLGAPVHVNRGWELPSECVQSYLYVVLIDGKRCGTGVCFSASGRVESFLGGYDSPRQFDFRWADEGLTADTLFLVIPAGILAVPLAIGMNVSRRVRTKRKLSVV